MIETKPRAFWRDRRGSATVEMAFVMLPFISMLFMILGVGVAFSLQSSLDAGVLTTSEGLRSGMMVGNSYAPPSAATLKSTIIANSGAMFTTANMAVDLRQLTTLSSSLVAITDGNDDWGSGGSVLVVRAQATLPNLPFFPPITITSMAIIRRPVS